MAIRNKKHQPGTFVEIPLAGGRRGFARLLPGSLVDVLDAFAGSGPSTDLAAVASQPALFTTSVENSSVNAWKPIGHINLDPSALARVVEFAHCDALNGNLSVRWRDLGSGSWGERPASLEEFRGLEPSAVWSGTQIAERLDDHLAGRPNRYLETLLARPQSCFRVGGPRGSSPEPRAGPANPNLKARTGTVS
jgi:hypothetical protein